MTTATERVGRIISVCMDDMLAHFKPGAKITVIVRRPGKPEADFLMTSDDLPEVAELIDRRKTSQ